MADPSAIKALLDALNDAERKEVFAHLRKSIPIHALEEKLMASAETILEAIARSPDLTVRGIEGIIAEAAFATEVIPTLKGWGEVPIPPEQAYDFLLDDGKGTVSVQVKMQRRKNRLPLMANDVYRPRKWPADHFIVETQRTRAGMGQAGESTRPYRFGSFDILGVSMGASQRRWSAFMYTLERWLIPMERDPSCVLVYQPIPPAPNQFWTDDFSTCVSWLRSRKQQTIKA